MCYEGIGVDLPPNITHWSDDHHRNTLSVGHLRENPRYSHEAQSYRLSSTLPPVMLGF